MLVRAVRWILDLEKLAGKFYPKLHQQTGLIEYEDSCDTSSQLMCSAIILNTFEFVVTV